MSSDPKIVTARLVLRPLERDDAADMFAYAQDGDVARYTSWPAHRTIDDAYTFIDRVVRKRNVTPGAFRLTWAVRLSADGPVVGTIGLIQDSAEAAHTDYALAKQHNGTKPQAKSSRINRGLRG